MNALVIAEKTTGDLKILVSGANNLVLEICDDLVCADTGVVLNKSDYTVVSEIVIEDEVVAKALKVTSEQKNLQVHYSYIKHLIARARNSLG